MRRLLAFLLMVSLLVAPCAAAELTIFAADSLSQIFSIQDQQPAQWSKGHPCVERAQSKEPTPVHEKCGADCLTWLSGEEIVLNSPLVGEAVKDGLTASVFARPALTHAHLRCEGPPPDWASDFNARERFVLARTQRLRI